MTLPALLHIADGIPAGLRAWCWLMVVALAAVFAWGVAGEWRNGGGGEGGAGVSETGPERQMPQLPMQDAG